MDHQNLDGLKKLILENEKWPLTYMFKFIAPNSDNKVELVVACLPKEGRITYNHTKNLKHVAVTCVATINTADQIIAITQQALSIPGVIAL